jgi:hypothetical protein
MHFLCRWQRHVTREFSGFKSAFFNLTACGDGSYAASAGCRSWSAACHPARRGATRAAAMFITRDAVA